VLFGDGQYCPLFLFAEELLERMVQKGGVKSLLILLTKSVDLDAQRFSALALGNAASACKLFELVVSIELALCFCSLNINVHHVCSFQSKSHGQ
jgi:hypothetical protein